MTNANTDKRAMSGGQAKNAMVNDGELVCKICGQGEFNNDADQHDDTNVEGHRFVPEVRK